MALFGIEPRAARVTWTVALVAGALYALYLVRTTLFVFTLAAFLSYMMAPLVRRLEHARHGRSRRTLAVATAFALVMVVIAVLAAIAGPVVSAQFSQLGEQLPDLARRVHTGDVPLPGILEPWRERMNAIVAQGLEGATRSAVPFAQRVAHGATALAGNLVYIVLVPILAFLFLKDGPAMRDALIRWLAPIARGATLHGIVDQLHESLGQYVRALGLLALATFAAYGAFFMIAGVPYGIVLAAIAALLEFIPLIGPLTAIGLALIVAAIAGYGHLLWMVGFFAVYRSVQDYVLAPRLMGGGLELHPALVIFGFLAGEQLGGVAGMFLSVPVLATLVIIVRYTAQREQQTNTKPVTK